MALLVLRVVVGASAALEAGLVIAGSHAALRLATTAAVSVAIAGLALVVGILTPIASVVCVGGAGMMLTCTPHASLLLFNSRMAVFEFVVMSAVVAVLGPGGISLDARLFGRREVVFRETPRPNDS